MGVEYVPLGKLMRKLEIVRGREHLEDLDVNVRIILNCILNRGPPL
jgi:hypothetical protein